MDDYLLNRHLGAIEDAEALREETREEASTYVWGATFNGLYELSMGAATRKMEELADELIDQIADLIEQGEDIGYALNTKHTG